MTNISESSALFLIVCVLIGFVTLMWFSWLFVRVLAHLLIKLYLYKWKYRNVARGVCCCGEDIEAHGYHSNHSPVDMLDHVVHCENPRTGVLNCARKPFDLLERLLLRIL